MYEKIKTMVAKYPRHYYIIGALIVLLCVCAGYIFYQPSGTDYQRARESVERIEKQQRESVEYNKRIQHSIDRSADLSREAKGRIERSTQYNNQIRERIEQSQSGLSEARGYLVRNAELFDRIERANRERQENDKKVTDAAQPITDVRGGCDNRSSNSSMTER